MIMFRTRLFLIVCYIGLIHSNKNNNNTKQLTQQFGITKLGPCTALLDDGRKVDLG